jgi:hypothetical protein
MLIVYQRWAPGEGKISPKNPQSAKITLCNLRNITIYSRAVAAEGDYGAREIGG